MRSRRGRPEAPGLAGLAMMSIARRDDLQRLLRKKVENGRFPNEQAVVEQALRPFLIEEPDQGQTSMSPATEPEKEDDEEARPWRGVYLDLHSVRNFAVKFFRDRSGT